mmetsp:Transcript_11249/g.23872  ORF Transcript_11249/g.23872 Transcript_11249/m.23872 type:complete len:105 (+) Transcript_11249:1656-1970(+)
MNIIKFIVLLSMVEFLLVFVQNKLKIKNQNISAESKAAEGDISPSPLYPKEDSFLFIVSMCCLGTVFTGVFRSHSSSKKGLISLVTASECDASWVYFVCHRMSI